MTKIMLSKKPLELLTAEAKKLGATSSAVISSKDIQAKDDLAALCNGSMALLYGGA